MTTTWGIMSTGRIAGDFARDIRAVPDAVIGAVGSRSAAAGKEFSQKFAIPTVHASAESLANDPSIDAVYIAGIHPVHRDHAILMMEAGKHVLVEKPLAMNATEAAEMTAVARRTNRFLMEAMWMRFNPLHVEIKRRLDSGEFGSVRAIEADFSFVGPDDPTHRLFDPTKGGGSLLDVGVYPITLAWWLVGAPDQWNAEVVIGNTGVDVSAALEFTWASGAHASLQCGTQRDGSRSATIVCDSATINIPAPAHSSPIAEITTANGTEVVKCAPPGLHHQVIEAQRCIAEGRIESSRMSHHDSVAIAQFIDDALAGGQRA